MDTHMTKLFHGSISSGTKDSTPPYLILEAGINHNGDLNLAKKMIDLAKDLGADAIKFQTFKADEFCGDRQQMFSYTSQGESVTEPMLDMFKRYEFNRMEWGELANYCSKIGITFLSTPQNLSDLEVLNQLGIPAIKIGSDDLTNTPLIRSYAKFEKPIILSSGMSNLMEISRAIEAAGWYEGKDVTILLCTSLYPTYSKDAGISRILTLRNAFPGIRVGFSDHTLGNNAAVLALALGARVFEKHFTLDHQFPGPDHWFSASPEEIDEWMKAIRDSWIILGNPQLRPMDSEIQNKKEFQRRIVALTKIFPGDTFTLQNVGLRRVAGGLGLSPEHLDIVFGLIARKEYAPGEHIEI
jgi:N,N'-diacetyllegionaminate synthase